ncbi:MAG: bifunctional [glutamate--ammonia ligase]-adenylyl-L-tyrosine phosphorylase/[glutamate--ammonia-ligase] adenylyltransferase [Woeseia sp.]
MSDAVRFEALLAGLKDGLPTTLEKPVLLWLERLAEQDAGAPDWLREHVPIAGKVLRTVAASEFAAQQLLRHWDWFTTAFTDTLPPETAATDRPLPADPDATSFMQWLRTTRNRGLLGILWRDLHDEAPVPETLADLSSLADRLIIAVEEYARQELAARFGRARDPEGREIPLVILAMGKLGGSELNFSSDIDLIFLYPQEGETDGARTLAAQDYFTRLARRSVALLEDVTGDGFVYRVDTRLRPFGDSGPVVASFAALESYLVNHGRSWERYAYVKARVITPPDDDATVQSLHAELINPFVYRRYLDYGVFESLRDMKSRIAAEVRTREMARNIKLGPGGIREIEFIVQSLQLVRGGNLRQLQCSSLQQALKVLREVKEIGYSTAADLDRTYCFLRRLENFLQALRDQQTHDLPTNRADQARLALALNYPDWNHLNADIKRHRAFVNSQFAEVAFRGEGERESSALTAALSRCCNIDCSESDWQSTFADEGYRNPQELAVIISEFLSSRATQQVDATAGKRLKALLPGLLGLLQNKSQPDVVLKRLLGILAAVLRRSAYVALLNENSAALERLVDLCERSGYLADEIARFPLLLDEMLDPRLYSARLTAELLRDDARERLASLGDTDSERQVEALARFQRAALFRVAAADFSGQLPVMKVSDRLTDLAEIVLGHALRIAWQDTVLKFGEPGLSDNGDRRAAGIGVIAYGKLGGIELSYRSDLDLVFLHDSHGTKQHTDGARELDNGVFFARLARRLVHFLTVQTGSGALYEVDTRLRPSGRAGMLVTSVDAFERYQAENAWTWEHQALLRARPVAGSTRIAREFERVRSHTLEHLVNRETLRDDVRSMRQKMRAELDDSASKSFDLKQGAGGIGDIEFLVQYLVLLNAAKHAEVIHYSDNIRQLGTLGAVGALNDRDVRQLQDTYRRYRTRLHHLSLDERPPLAEPHEFSAERALVRDLWDRILG